MKNELRIIAKNHKKLLHNEERDLMIINNLRNTIEYKNAKNILLYYPLKYEINTLNCLNDSDKNFFLPRVKGDDLEICPYKKGCLKKGAFLIQEPTGEKISESSIIDIALIPALAADFNGYRLGYGKGYYDRFLKTVNCKKITLVYEQLLFDTVFPESFDEKCDMVICEKYIINL